MFGNCLGWFKQLSAEGWLLITQNEKEDEGTTISNVETKNML